MRTTCPHCPRLLVPSDGPLRSKVLILGEFPGEEEVKEGRPWVGPAGQVLRAELSRAGVRYEDCRVANLWLHGKVKDCNFDWHLAQAKKELKGRKAVLLLGSEVAKAFLGVSVTDVTGLRVKSDLFPESVELAVACYNPAILIGKAKMSVGEVRLAIERFAKWSAPWRAT